MNTTKYKVTLKKQGFNKLYDRIAEIEIIRETSAFVYITNGTRVAKSSEFGNYYDSYKEAYNALHAHQLKYIANCENFLRKAKEGLAAIEQLKEDK